MLISELITQLEHVEKHYGDIDVTCTGFAGEETDHGMDGTSFETTVENLIVGKWKHGTKVRLWL